MAQYGTPEEAEAMLDKAVVALKEDKTKTLDMFNKGDGGFEDRDLYVYCANASDGIFTAHPKLKGKQLKDLKGEKGFPLGKEIMEKATEGKMREVTYWWPRPGSDKPLEKHTFFHEGWRSNLRCWLLQVDLRLRHPMSDATFLDTLKGAALIATFVGFLTIFAMWVSLWDNVWRVSVEQTRAMGRVSLSALIAETVAITSGGASSAGRDALATCSN